MTGMNSAANRRATMRPHHGRPLFAAYAVPIATAAVAQSRPMYHQISKDTSIRHCYEVHTVFTHRNFLIYFHLLIMRVIGFFYLLMWGII